MNGDYSWVTNEEDANFLYGGERFVLTDSDIKRLKRGDILNFFVNDEYGCTLRYTKKGDLK